MITADQIAVHAIGDYILQSDWMANEKTKRFVPAFSHALVYSLPFWMFRPSLTAWIVIFVTHFFIDRYRLARYVCFAKNCILGDFDPKYFHWSDYAINKNTTEYREVKGCNATGYPADRPAWLAVWLLIFADNILHICINGAALKFL